MIKLVVFRKIFGKSFLACMEQKTVHTATLGTLSLFLKNNKRNVGSDGLVSFLTSCKTLCGPCRYRPHSVFVFFHTICHVAMLVVSTYLNESVAKGALVSSIGMNLSVPVTER